MQFIKCTREALLKPLQTVGGIVEGRQTLPILANVLIQKEKDKVSFTTTDLESRSAQPLMSAQGTKIARLHCPRPNYWLCSPLCREPQQKLPSTQKNARWCSLPQIRASRFHNCLRRTTQNSTHPK